ncbi:hypothetical protein PJ311_01235 [Bacillus sp. CLL-7-23]|uniref:Uncharacterized protein n=1 Tax=Bacillus changyiensis TaxID=3004103 RepID=A0ABT4WYV0_9BACI|nr:hypothetical protein [Bacillus changyiensis]MDA7025228.1 hypothetical protein [Bacillus changyiensis]
MAQLADYKLLLLFLFDKTNGDTNQDSGFFPVSHNHHDTYSDFSDSGGSSGGDCGGGDGGC